ncbi:glycosyltransferase [Marivivens donghaensis]|uniref:Glycosyltransferase n=1 Tax=Marivivens donghaensis TaxID=1699413 RepID=A0ABX0VXC2_9RHOB|nr:glycosyltransferase [Marivivens donghaensis]NIY72070.1 glycosyltransferase [Marivivens donghaensis]
MKARLLLALGINPHRRRVGSFWIKITQFAVGTVELLLLFTPYVRTFRRLPKVDLMVVGAQKAGTTWLDAQLRGLNDCRLPDIKELHHFDRGRCWTLRRYLRQLGSGTVIEIAPDYGPMAAWRIRAMRRLFPDMKVAMILRHPAERDWSGLRMEMGFDSGRPLGDVPVAAMLRYLKSRRGRRYSDYSTHISRWSAVFGRQNLLLVPFDDIAQDPAGVVERVLSHADLNAGAPTISPEPVFAGEAQNPPPAVAAFLNRRAGAQIAKLPPEWAERWDRQLQTSRSGKALYICGFCPNQRATSSGQKLAHRKITEMAMHFAQVDVIYFRNKLDRLDPQPANWPANVRVLKDFEVGPKQRLLGALRWPHLPKFASARRWAAGRVIGRLVQSADYRAFYADFSQGAGAISEDSLPLFEFRQHDVVSKLYDRMAVRRPMLRLEALLTRRWERRVWSRVAQVTTLSEEDAAEISAVGVEARAEPVSGTVSIAKPAPISGRIIFWGNMARAENEDAAVRLVNDILPRVKIAVPDAHVWIVGAHPTERVRAIAAKDVTVTGFIEDPSPVLATASVAAVPLRLGSGVKIKVLETLEGGIPTVVSPVGGEGIPDHPILTRVDDDRAMAHAIIDILTAQNVPAAKSDMREMANGGTQSGPTEMREKKCSAPPASVAAMSNVPVGAAQLTASASRSAGAPEVPI